LSPGADPQSEVVRLAEEINLGQGKFKPISLGEGMGE
jgi:hypothetical protein